MKFKLFIFLLVSSFAFGQGAVVAPQVALKTVNGQTFPLANATITVCAQNTGGLPCSPPLANVVYSDAALTHPLSNPFTADANGNYNFAVVAGSYTVTVTGSGFAGNSYQLTVQCPLNGSCVTSGNGAISPNNTGNNNACVQYVGNGGSVTVQPATTPCGAGGSVGPGTTGFIPLFVSSTTVGNAHVDDGVTTALTIHSSENVETAGSMTTGVGGSTAGLDALGGNTANPSFPSNAAGFLGPASASFTSYFGQFPSTAPAAHSVVIWPAPTANVAAFSFKVIPDCQDTAGKHINYTQSTDTFSCGTTSSGGVGGTPGGTTGDVQINTSGAFDADSGIFTYSKANHQLQVGSAATQYVGPITTTQTFSDNGPHRMFEDATAWTPGASAASNGACAFCDDATVIGSNAADHWASFQSGGSITAHVGLVYGFEFAPSITYSGAAVRAIEIKAIGGGVTPSSNRAITIDADTERDWTFISDSTQKSYMAGPIALNGAVDPTVSSSGVYVTGTLTNKPGVFSGLPACSSTTEGSRAAVTDSTVNTWGSTIAGSGTNHVLAYCDGTNWTVEAK